VNNDKKRTFVLLGLAGILLAVGAFQVVGGLGKAEIKVTKAAPKSRPAKEAEPKQDPGPNELLALAHPALPPRDPFLPQVVEQEAEPEQSAPAPSLGGPRQANASQAVRAEAPRPAPMTGAAPLEPLPLGALPASGIPAGQIKLSKAAPLRQPDEFGYSVKGVIVGRKPLAVFEDSQGNQLLVPVGGSVGSDAKLLGIERGKVKIRHRGKDKTLALSE
jgi:hypothetical protein